MPAPLPPPFPPPPQPPAHVGAPAMWCVDNIRDYLFTDAAAREEKSITAVSRDPIPVEDFIEVLTKKRKKGSLAIEFKVSVLFNLVLAYSNHSVIIQDIRIIQ